MLRSAAMAKRATYASEESYARSHSAEYQRQRRARLKALAKPVVQSTPKRSEERIRSDEALEAAILMRGRQLTAMMRTPMCMWPSEWLSND